MPLQALLPVWSNPLASFSTINQPTTYRCSYYPKRLCTHTMCRIFVSSPACLQTIASSELPRPGSQSQSESLDQSQKRVTGQSESLAPVKPKRPTSRLCRSSAPLQRRGPGESVAMSLVQCRWYSSRTPGMSTFVQPDPVVAPPAALVWPGGPAVTRGQTPHLA